MFQIHALPRAAFADLFALDDVALAARGAVRRIADATGGFPCRISLIDAAPGEELILTNYEHQDAASPFRASHAVYVRVAAEEAHPAPSEVPSQLRTRMLSLRAFDAAGMMLDFELIDGRAIETGIARLLADPATAYLHAHFAGPGCYAARIDRG